MFVTNQAHSQVLKHYYYNIYTFIQTFKNIFAFYYVMACRSHHVEAAPKCSGSSLWTATDHHPGHLRPGNHVGIPHEEARMSHAPAAPRETWRPRVRAGLSQGGGNDGSTCSWECDESNARQRWERGFLNGHERPWWACCATDRITWQLLLHRTARQFRQAV